MARKMAKSFACSVCGKTKPLKGGRGKPNYVTDPDGASTCNPCSDNRDTALMREEGKITLLLDLIGQKWYALSRTRNLRFPLLTSEGQSLAQALGCPRFRDKGGNLWSGRFYSSSGSAHFQMTQVADEEESPKAKAKVKAPAKAKPKPKPRAKTKARGKAKAPPNEALAPPEVKAEATPEVKAEVAPEVVPEGVEVSVEVSREASAAAGAPLSGVVFLDDEGELD